MNPVINALVWSFLIFTTVSSKSLTQVSQQLEQKESFCQYDYLVIRTGNNSILSFSDSFGKSLSLTEKKVSRHELVRKEAHDGQNHQWVIRTWDGSHLAIDNKGKIIVQTGCVSATFLRVIQPEHLQQCVEENNCTMFLCATSISTGDSFLVTPENKRRGYPLPRGRCETYATFKIDETLKDLEKSGYKQEQFIFTFLKAASQEGRQLLSNGLKRMCPRSFDPNGETRKDLCSKV